MPPCSGWKVTTLFAGVHTHTHTQDELRSGLIGRTVDGFKNATMQWLESNDTFRRCTHTHTHTHPSKMRADTALRLRGPADESHLVCVCVCNLYVCVCNLYVCVCNLYKCVCIIDIM
jgi:hypothetical protein